MSPLNGTENKPQAQPREILPRCPYCKARPCVMKLLPSQFGPIPCATFICSKCEKIISVAVMPMPPQQPQRQDHSILIPGRG